ncbi:MAG TPA: dihydrolipoamide acetyltransferase family protein [Kineosporiaceae bacterium]|nr:dihydrolipoamide acetyltransferase family protein [Kineosporiaceae bacterium]
MPNIQQFRLPDAGEGLTEAEIVTWRVHPGDTVRINDPIVEIETAKSLVELPSPYAGVVTELLVPEGVTVDVGTPIIAVDTAPDGSTATSPGEQIPPGVQIQPAEAAVEPGMVGGPAPGGRTSVLVGYGPRTTAAVRRPRRRPGEAAAHPVPATSVAPAATARAAPVQAPAPVETPGPTDVPAARAHGLAKPPVRKLAKDLGVDITTVEPTGPRGVVTREDVERAVGAAASDAATAAAAGVPGTVAARPLAAVRTGERETRIPIKGVRRVTADAVVASAFTAPHVTEWVTVDVTRTMKLVDRLRAERDFAGVRVSPLLVVAKALLIAVRRNPQINATWDAAAGEIVVKHYVNLGIAAATSRGLVVPNIKDADQLSLRDLAVALGELTTAARDGRTQPADMSGGTITITNVGVFGVDAGTPILNPGESAILAFGRVRQLPWVHKGKVKPRWVTQLALSFDHRLVDGDLGSRTLADLGAVLEDPARALVWS